MDNSKSQESLLKQRKSHILYIIKGLLTGKQKFLFKVQSSFIMILYFALQTLDVLNAIDELENLKQQILDLIYSLVIRRKQQSGFKCSTLYSQSIQSQDQYNVPHIVFTYSALNCLKILGDDLSKLDKQKIINSIRKCRKSDGSFSNFQNTTEADLRFVYAACAISNLLNDLSAIDIPQTKKYIQSCLNFDGGFGLRPNCQSHCGAIYCAVSSLKFLNCLDQFPKLKILHFLVNRQTYNLENQNIIGIQGRVGKLPDSCYSFWAGASIILLTNKQLINPKVRNFINLCLTPQGSYSKYPEMQEGDPVHTLHSIVGILICNNKSQNLSLMNGIKIQRLL